MLSFNRLTKVNILQFTLALIFISVFLTLFTAPKNASASYDGGRIIDNAVLLDANSMSAQDIQNFLASKGSGLASRSFLLNCYGSTSQERQLYTSVGAPCDQTIPASHIIYYASQIYGINPKAVLATLQKEQSLITSPNPTDWQVNQAMGYACPTSGQCGGNSTFGYQIDSGVWVIRYHYERANGNMSWWSQSSSWTCGTPKNFYTPNLYPNQNVNFYDENGVMYRTHFIANAATSSFYCYTPHAYNNPQGLYGRAPYGTTGMYYSGSYNFVYYFELWFGTTQTPNYSWSLVSQNVYTDQTKSTPTSTSNLAPNSKIYVSIQIRNTGNLTWSNSGPNPVRFGTVRSYERQSIFCDNTWPSCSRPANMTETSVAPNNIATFNFWMKAPMSGSTTQEYFAPLVEGLSWMQDIGLFFNMQSTTATYSWQLMSQYAYTDQTKTVQKNLGSLMPGEKAYVGFTAKNAGNMTWKNNDSNALMVGTISPLERQSPFSPGSSWLTATRPALLKESTVAPGATGTFEFWITAPASPGVRNERFNIIANNLTWFNDVGLSFYTQVN
ncbi:MAG: hypothetical protein Q7T41_03050 [Candidatus Saccharibacteria bacterium]|nr:hypothetical protein [Candidatus Saccharibacteria bacterium]